MPNDPWTAEQVLAVANDWVWVPRGSVNRRTDEFLAVVPPDFMDLPVLVRVFGSRRRTGDLVDEIVELAAGWGQSRLSWRLSDGAEPADLEEELLRRGAVVDVRLDVLGLPLADGLPDFGVPPEVTVREVTDEAVLRDAHAVSTDAFGGGSTSDEQIATELEELRTGLPEGPVGRVVSYVDGRPAGTGGWTLAGPVARLWGGATHTDLRGRGAYRAVLAERLRLARAAGATLGLSLGRVETAAPILRGLGFVRYGEQREVVLDASGG
ncbi:MAG TPA: hypothetical protein VNS83_00355 [Lapillicoccus sp.]|nr:hypothetical protein [Lapillicoccus sp.]